MELKKLLDLASESQAFCWASQLNDSEYLLNHAMTRCFLKGRYIYLFIYKMRSWNIYKELI